MTELLLINLSNTFANKYRPKVFNEVVGNIDERRMFETQFVESIKKGERVNHILLYGPSGTGKTSLVRIAIQYFYDYLERPVDFDKIVSFYSSVNFGEDEGTSLVNNEIKKFVEGFSGMQGFVVIETADQLCSEAQGKLKDLLDFGCENVTVILVTNYINKIIPSLKSHTAPIGLRKLTSSSLLHIGKKISRMENLGLGDEYLKSVATMCSGDGRMMVNYMMLVASGNMKDINELFDDTIIADRVASYILRYAKTKGMREAISYKESAVSVMNKIGNFESFCKAFMESVNTRKYNEGEFLPHMRMSIASIVNLYLHRSEVVDPHNEVFVDGFISDLCLKIENYTRKEFTERLNGNILVGEIKKTVVAIREYYESKLGNDDFEF